MHLESNAAVAVCCWNKVGQDAANHDLYLSHLDPKVWPFDWISTQLHQFYTS